MSGPSVTRRIGRAVRVILLLAGLLQLAIALVVIDHEARVLREQITVFGLELARLSADAGALDPARLGRALGNNPGMAIVGYDAEGRLVGASRSDVAVSPRLSRDVLERARRDAGRMVFLEPISLWSDNVAVLGLESGRGGYVGIVDRWATRRVARGVLVGVVGGFFAALLVGLVATRALAVRARRALARAETVVGRIAGGALAERLPDFGDDEVGRLGRSFNAMAGELEARIDELRREQDRRRRAFADWSHELATPLSSVLGYLESLEMGGLDAGTARRYSRTAYEQALALKALSDDLATLAQVDFDGLRLERSAFDPSEAVEREVAALMPVATKKGVLLETRVAPIEGFEGDRARFGRVLKNLLCNAIRHTDPGKRVLVSAEVEDNEVVLDVNDEGEGMDPEHIARVGEPFFRADASRDRRTGGRGLGLAIAKGIVAAHGGTLDLASERGRGTRVRVRLPLTRKAPLLALALGALSCRVELDDEELDFDFATAAERCVVPSPNGVTRGGAFSLALPEGSYFLFGETVQGAGDTLRVTGSSGALARRGADPCGGLDDVEDEAGELAELLSTTPEEEALDAAAADGRASVLWPLSGFVRGNEGLIFYAKARRLSSLDVLPVGVGVARIRYGERAERLRPNRFPDEPTLHWLGAENAWGGGAFLAPDGFVYLYGCYHRGHLDDVCRAARVLPGAAEDADAYRYFDGAEWTPQPESARAILSGLQSLSVSHSAHLGRFVALRPAYLDNRVLGGGTPTPAGPFARTHELFLGTVPSSFWIRDVALHPAYASADGRRFLVSYYSDPSEGPAGMRLVEVTLK